MAQPSGMTNDSGLIVTIGINNVIDRMAIVFPVTTNSDFTKSQSAGFLVDGIVTGDALSLLLACLAETTYVSYVQAEGWTDGVIPSRHDFVPETKVGTRTGNPCSGQVAGLAIFYADPDDIPPGGRIRLGKNFIPGISADDLSADFISPELASAINAWAESVAVDGITSSGGTFYRVVGPSNTRAPGTNVIRANGGGSRGYVVTQRRRLIPR